MLLRVFLASTKPLADPAVFERLYAEASETRKKKIDRCRFLSDRMQLLAAESLLRHALKEVGRDAGALSFAYGAHGKPYLNDAEGFYFNLSHSGETVLLAVSDAEIGCDVERIRHVRDGVARRILTPEEYARFSACAGDERDVLLTRLWVAKESYLKACGEGITTDPAAIRIEFGTEPDVFRDGNPVPYALREGAADGYRYAVCRAGGLPPFVTEPVLLSDPDGDGLASKEAFGREIRKRLAEHRLRCPAMEWEDAVKFVFQAMLGVGHLLSSRAAVEAYLVREMSGLKPDPDEPLFEPLSPVWGRLNLRRAMAEGMTAETVAERMLDSGTVGEFTRQDVYGFCKALAASGAFRVPDPDPAERILDETVLPSHSQAYREAYRPAYRVIRTERTP